MVARGSRNVEMCRAQEASDSVASEINGLLSTKDQECSAQMIKSLRLRLKLKQEANQSKKNQNHSSKERKKSRYTTTKGNRKRYNKPGTTTPLTTVRRTSRRGSTRHTRRSPRATGGGITSPGTTTPLLTVRRTTRRDSTRHTGRREATPTTPQPETD